ncbi:MAG: phosphoribosylanthranilate isomerase [Asticcacaulis sp.]
MTVASKICGITTLEAARHAAAEGAAFLGFIHFAPSPRHLALDAMAELMHLIRGERLTLPLVSVVVNPDDEALAVLRDDVRPDLIQLHGKETPQRVAEIAAITSIPLIKVISVAEATDLEKAAAYEPHADYLMFDAKTPKGAAMPGGLGVSFDWPLMRAYRGSKPWFLAGGLTPENVADAVSRSGAAFVDVSSGVESAPGVKDPVLISRFLKAAKAL